MITNLFSIFDPSSSQIISNNWLSILRWLIFIPLSFFIVSSRIKLIFLNLINYIFNEFKPLISKNPQIIIIPLTLFIFILINNITGLLPFIFTPTSHITIRIGIALPLWLGIILYGWLFNYNNLLIHLIPNETPFILIPFIVIIETIRNIIRPLTLAIRLAANIIAGHLLLSILITASERTPIYLYPLLILPQIALSSLEVAVALIQAYVFRVLLTIYSSERIS